MLSSWHRFIATWWPLPALLRRCCTTVGVLCSGVHRYNIPITNLEVISNEVKQILPQVL